MESDPLSLYLTDRSPGRFAALIESSHRDLLRAAYRILGDLELAENAVQDVYLDLLTTTRRPEDVRTWKGFLVRAAVNKAKERLRSECRRRRREEQAAGGRRHRRRV